MLTARIFIYISLGRDAENYQIRSKEKTAFEGQVDAVKRRMRNAENEMLQVRINLRNNNMPGAYEAAFDLANAAEKLTIATRELPAYTGHPLARKTMNEQIVETAPVKLGFTKKAGLFLKSPHCCTKSKKAMQSTSWVCCIR